MKLAVLAFSATLLAMGALRIAVERSETRKYDAFMQVYHNAWRG